MSTLRKLVNRIRGTSAHTHEEEFTSEPLRARFRAAGVEIGLYSYGCFDLRRVPAGTTVGRYCSFADSCQVFLRDHGIGFIGLTAYLYNPARGVVQRNMIEHATLSIGDDVWIGHNATILSGTRTIGRGAVIAAGAIVTKPVPAYAVVAGNPARVVRMRFKDDIIAQIEQTRWWELDTQALKRLVDERPEMMFDPARFFGEGQHAGSGQ